MNMHVYTGTQTSVTFLSGIFIFYWKLSCICFNNTLFLLFGVGFFIQFHAIFLRFLYICFLEFPTFITFSSFCVSFYLSYFYSRMCSSLGDEICRFLCGYHKLPHVALLNTFKVSKCISFFHFIITEIVDKTFGNLNENFGTAQVIYCSLYYTKPLTLSTAPFPQWVAENIHFCLIVACLTSYARKLFLKLLVPPSDIKVKLHTFLLYWYNQTKKH